MGKRIIIAGFHSRNSKTLAFVAVTGRSFTLRQLNALDRQVRGLSRRGLHCSMTQHELVGQQSQGLIIRADGQIDRADFEAMIQKLFVPTTVEFSWINSANETNQRTIRQLYRSSFPTG